MKYFVKLIVITLFLFFANYAYANQVIRFINMNELMNNSKAGKEAQSILVTMQKKNIENFITIPNNSNIVVVVKMF